MVKSSRERFLKALNLETPDYVPLHDFLFMQDIYKEVLGHRPEAYNAEDAVNCALKLGLDAIWVPTGGFSGYSPKMVSANQYIDEWGTTFQKDAASWPIDAPIAYPLANWNDYKNWTPPSPDDDNRTAEVRTALKIANKQIAVCGGVTGPFTTALFLMGLENLSMGFYDDPELVDEIMKQANKFNITMGKKLVACGVDAMFVSDDLGYNEQLFLSPDMMRKYVLPHVFELVRELRSTGVKVILHCDGNLNEIIDDLVHCGINAYHPVERKSHMDLAAVKRTYGKIICPFGNVDSSTTLPYGSKEEIEAQVRECIRSAAYDGGYVLGSDHSIHDRIPTDNVLTMFEAARKWGHYPIRSDV